MKCFKLLMFLLLCGQVCLGQSDDPDDDYYEIKKERHFGVNAAPLLANLIPFNEARDLRLGTYNLSYYRIINDRRMFRFGIGVQIDDDIPDRNHFNMRLGWARAYQFSEKWSHYRGIDFRLFAGSMNLPDDNDDDDGGFGIAPVYGLEFEVVPRFSISTETSLFIGLTSDGPRIEYFPPFTLYLNVHFN